MSTVVPEKWATREDAARHLQITPGQVDRLRKRGMPSVKLGQARGATRRFWLPDVDRWVREHGIDGKDAA